MWLPGKQGVMSRGLRVWQASARRPGQGCGLGMVGVVLEEAFQDGGRERGVKSGGPSWSGGQACPGGRGGATRGSESGSPRGLLEPGVTCGPGESTDGTGTREDGMASGGAVSPSLSPQDMEKEQETLRAWKDRVARELDRVVAFWLDHSHDQEQGGFFTCLGRDGQVYDDLKYVWLQGRQVWMYCRLYRQFERFRRPELLNAAKAGGEFLLRYAQVAPPAKKCAFVLTRDGRPVKVQRTIFSECFYTMAMNELWRVTGDARYQNEAMEMMDQIVSWVREDPSGLGRPQLPGAPASESMAVPMMLLNLVEQLGEADEELAGISAELGDWCAQRILQHVQRGGQAVLENVSEDGEELSGCLGRHQNPGHALEAGWFLLRYAIQRGDAKLRAHVIDKFLLLPFHSGWDPEHGGLFYFQDADGLCPTQLEWAMKLWWPHSEAMIAFLMGYSETGDPALLRIFYQVAEYTFHRFRDPEYGEWFGYLNRDGKVALTIKGGPFKGCFHVPRCLAMCEEMLNNLLSRLAPASALSTRSPPAGPARPGAE